MKTITFCHKNMLQQLFSIKLSEWEFSVLKTHAASDDRIANQGTILYAETVLKCFIMSSVRTIIIVLTTLAKTMNALFALVKLVFKATLSSME